MSLVRAAALLAALLLFGCQPGASQPLEAKAGAEPAASDGVAGEETPVRDPVLVRVVPIPVGPIERRLEVTATVESLDVVDVIPERSEPVLEVLVEEGDHVVKGQVLARMRTQVCQMAKDEALVTLADSENTLEQARRDYERNRALAESPEGSGRLLSERDLEASAQAVVQAETAAEQARVALSRAEFDLSNCVLRAPIAGTIAARDLSVGDFATMGQRAFQIVDTSSPKAIFFRPQRELALLHVGQQLEATTEALPGVTIQGEIERISPTVDPLSGTVKVTAALRSEEVAVPVGVLVSLVLVLDRHENALLLPKRALLFEGRRPYCFVVRGNEAVRLDLEAGFENPDYLEAIPGADGPWDGDRVVIVGADRLAPGDPVEIAGATAGEIPEDSAAAADAGGPEGE